jgi:hypothetical protein
MILITAATGQVGGHAAHGAGDREVTPTLQQLLGRPPRSLSEFLHDHRAMLRKA